MPADGDLAAPAASPDEVRDAPLATFATACRGSSAPEDALAWLADPTRTGPSGAASPVARLRAARGDLYRPGAAPGAADRYRAIEEGLRDDRRAAVVALAAARTGASPTVTPGPDVAAPPALAPARPVVRVRRGRRVLVVAAAAVIVGGLCAGVAATALPHTAASKPGHTAAVPTPLPTVTARAVPVEPVMRPAADRWLRQAFVIVGSDVSSAALDELDSVTATALAPPPDALVQSQFEALGVSEHGQPVDEPLDGSLRFVRRPAAGGELVVAMILQRPAAWRWVVYAVPRTGPAIRSVAIAVVAGSPAAGRLQAARVRVPKGLVPSGLRLTTSPHTPYFWRGDYRS